MERNLTLVMTCPFCGKDHTVNVKEEDYSRYITTNVLIQDVFSYLTITEREQIISGICPSCQKDIFGE